MEKLGVNLDAQQAEVREWEYREILFSKLFQDMVVEIDKDKSGEIDYQEFKMFMQS